MKAIFRWHDLSRTYSQEFAGSLRLSCLRYGAAVGKLLRYRNPGLKRLKTAGLVQVENGRAAPSDTDRRDRSLSSKAKIPACLQVISIWRRGGD
jgi:hypothetical protein